MTTQPGTFGEGIAPRWGYQTSFWQRRQPAFWLFVVSLALTGFVMLGQQLEMIDVAPGAWLLTLVLLVPYAIPVVLVIYWLDLYEREPVSILAAALLWGGVVATTLSIYTNTPLAELIFKLTADPLFTSEWSAALTAPFVEEGFKALGIILLVSIARAELDDVLDGFVWGAMVGIGFLLVENVFYFMNAFVATGGSFEGIIQIFLIRIVGAGPYSHFLYTGLIGMGIAYYHTRTDRTRGRRVAVGVALAAAGVAAHFFWNSPILAELLGDGSPLDWLLYTTAKGLPMLIGLILVVRLARSRERQWFERFAAIGADDGTITPEEMHELGSVRRRWSARRAAGIRYGAPGKRLKGLVQRQQINLAMVASRVGAVPDHPDLVKQRDLVRILKAEYAALAGAATGPTWAAHPRAPAAAQAGSSSAAQPTAQPGAQLQPGLQPGAQPPPGLQPGAQPPPGLQPRPAIAAQPQPVAQPAATTQPAVVPPPPPPPAAWRPTHRVPDEGMAAWAAPDPTRAPMVSLGGRLDLVVVQVAGDWARVVAVNGWSGWVDGRRLVPHG